MQNVAGFYQDIVVLRKLAAYSIPSNNTGSDSLNKWAEERKTVYKDLFYRFPVKFVFVSARCVRAFRSKDKC